jgi:hypothetical protein
MKKCALLFVAATLVSTAAFADDKAACLDAASKGQTLRDAHKLVEARQQLRICAAATCPAVVQTDCVGWLADVEQALPSVVVSAKSGAGADLVDVKVSVDGQLLSSRIDGQAVAMDAGPHTFHFEGADGTSLDQQVVVREGEKNQTIAVVLGKPATTQEGQLGQPPPASTGLGTQKVLGLVVGGVGVAGIAVGSVFGLLTASAISQQKSDCASSTNCPHPQAAASDHSTWTTDSTVSTVAFIAGGVLLAGGAVLFLLPHQSPAQPAATGLVVTPSVGPGGGGMIMRGAF